MMGPAPGARPAMLGISRVTVSSYVHANGVPGRQNGGRPRPPRRAPRCGSGSFAGVAEAPHRAAHGNVVVDGTTVAGGEIRLPDHSGWSSRLPGPPRRGRRRPGHPRDTPVSLTEARGSAGWHAAGGRGEPEAERVPTGNRGAPERPAAIVDGDLTALAGCRDRCGRQCARFRSRTITSGRLANAPGSTPTADAWRETWPQSSASSSTRG